MIKGIIERIGKASRSNGGCYGYGPYLGFKSPNADSESARLVRTDARHGARPVNGKSART
ncbi:MAG: hypothetical protein H0S85_07620 [Desulfovibrionaceae bacterium]|jgi:hypothetical protein|nr:hypothetical protein [Desulfovibrionaceae bacterium]